MHFEGILPDTGQPVRVDVAEGLIRGVAEIGAPAAWLPYLAPGMIDLQVNGYHGSDYSLEELNEDHVRRIVERLAISGVTRHLATIVSSPPERTLRNLDLVSGLLRGFPELADAVMGFHLEGPFISAEEGPRGAHDPKHIRNPDFGLFQEWTRAACGFIRLITVAPELPGAAAFIERVVREGVRVAIGHTAADAQTLGRAVEAGATLSTHLGVGSHLNLPRLRNYVWEQLAEDRLWASLICDGFHLPPAVVKVMARVKGSERLLLISDAAVMGGYPPGAYRWGDLPVEVHPDGHLGLAGTGYMAGAAHLLDWDVVRFQHFTGWTLADTLRLCTQNPARFLGLADGTGSLEPGAPADLILFEHAPGDERLRILRTLRAGRTVHQIEGAGA